MKNILLFGALILSFVPFAFAGDPSQLKPPKGYKVALVEFVDLECPDCANAFPVLEDARHTYKIPLVRYDFPLQKHNWARQAAVLARFFDTKSKNVGDEFRQFCFEHQRVISSPEQLRQQAEKFAQEKSISLPLVVDPDGSLEAKVNQDVSLGNAVGIEHTPTIYVVSNNSTGKPFVEVVDRSNLFQQIDEMIASAGGTTDTPAGKHAKKKASTAAVTR